MVIESVCPAWVRARRHCSAPFDAAPGVEDETRCCGAGLHRFRWQGRSWRVDVSYDPVDAGGSTAP